ncbi:MAG: acyl-ACP--UDP-N-acetylglucosamine O-acyltransferase [Armatimonadetes bacterium]|nr:acyl-ACP--UDP-N-acetylglucosamine O-acyltransferase [Armatimonadota bacterium]
MREPASTRGPTVHPTAVVHPLAELDDGVEIGPYAVLAADVTIGAGTVVGAHSVIHDGVRVGHNNTLAAHVILGGLPQDRAYRGERTGVVVGDGNILSEFVSVDRATGEGQETRIGSGAYIMSFVKISHNCDIGDGATIVSGSQVAGRVHIGEHAFIGGMSGIHQFVHIGRLVMVGGLSGVSQDVPPYLMVAGFRCRAVGLNRVGLQRHGVPPEDRLALRRAFRIFFQSGLSMEAALRALEEEAARSVPVQHFLDFMRAARTRNRGIVRWQVETE